VTVGAVTSQGRRAALTATELVVADLVARGRRDSEIAHELGLSSRTVEQTMTRVYRKLGVASRAELLARKENVDE
jgi:DNA-binding CsgD family transcriptional regulator